MCRWCTWDSNRDGKGFLWPICFSVYDLTKQVKISRPRNFAAPRNEKNHMLPDAKKLVKNLGENPKLPAKFLLE